MKNCILVCVTFCLSLSLWAQDISDYKYIVVPQKFEFQDNPGQYNLNKLSRFLFIKWGFDAYLESENLPDDLNATGCNTLYARADVSGFLSTKALIKLVNCKGKEVVKLEGQSKIKKYAEGHQDAFRKAFDGLKDLGYTYSEEVVDAPEFLEQEKEVIPETQKSGYSNTETNLIKVAAIPKDSDIIIKEELQLGEERGEIKHKNKNAGPVKAGLGNILKSGDGVYTLRTSENGFEVYEAQEKIGRAIKTSRGSYLVNTSQFIGLGYYEGSVFIVEREVKGVSNLIKMVFTGN